MSFVSAAARTAPWRNLRQGLKLPNIIQKSEAFKFSKWKTYFAMAVSQHFWPPPALLHLYADSVAYVPSAKTLGLLPPPFSFSSSSSALPPASSRSRCSAQTQGSEFHRWLFGSPSSHFEYLQSIRHVRPGSKEPHGKPCQIWFQRGWRWAFWQIVARRWEFLDDFAVSTEHH